MKLLNNKNLTRQLMHMEQEQNNNNNNNHNNHHHSHNSRIKGTESIKESKTSEKNQSPSSSITPSRKQIWNPFKKHHRDHDLCYNHMTAAGQMEDSRGSGCPDPVTARGGAAQADHCPGRECWTLWRSICWTSPTLSSRVLSSSFRSKRV
uniref:Uncharacterized protein n=1 Tax=Cacopsylla melanoneura TaxID=428564 RepID=A0A8D8RDP3_9HEMI